jgi:hypothetical protein
VSSGEGWILAGVALVVATVIAVLVVLGPSCVRGHYETRIDPGGYKYGIGLDGKYGYHWEMPKPVTEYICDETGPSMYEAWKARRKR